MKLELSEKKTEEYKPCGTRTLTRERRLAFDWSEPAWITLIGATLAFMKAWFGF